MDNLMQHTQRHYYTLYASETSLNIFRYSYFVCFFFLSMNFIHFNTSRCKADREEKKKNRTKKGVEREKEEAGNNKNMNNMLKLYKRVFSVFFLFIVPRFVSFAYQKGMPLHTHRSSGVGTQKQTD